MSEQPKPEYSRQTISDKESFAQTSDRAPNSNKFSFRKPKLFGRKRDKAKLLLK